MKPKRRRNTKPCSVSGCENPMDSHGWCCAHAARWRKHGSVLEHIPLGRGWGRQGDWTEAEDYFILDNPDLTASDVAAVLGRTYDSIASRRRVLTQQDPSLRFNEVKGRHPSQRAWVVGSRRLLCKTCPKCGLLLDAEWFIKQVNSHNGGRGYSSACRTCSSAAWKANTTETMRASARTAEATMERIAAERAERKGQEYTAADIEILADKNLSLFQMALATKRTLAGVKHARRNYLPDDKRLVRLGEPSESQWVIQFAAPIRDAFGITAKTKKKVAA